MNAHKQGWNKAHTKWTARLCFHLVEECPCCQKQLWHCKECWDKYHNGKRDEDWVAPAYEGQPLFPKNFKRQMQHIIKKIMADASDKCFTERDFSCEKKFAEWEKANPI